MARQDRVLPEEKGHNHKDHFTKGLWAYNWKLVKILLAIILIIMIQLSHDFAHATTAHLLCHLQKYDLIAYFFMKELHVYWRDLNNKLINPL